MIPRLAEVFVTKEVTQSVLKGKDEQLYEPLIQAQREDGNGGMGGTTGSGEDGTAEEDADLAGAY